MQTGKAHVLSSYEFMLSILQDDDVLFIGTRFSTLYTAVDTPA
jgi:hypothetical protein